MTLEGALEFVPGGRRYPGRHTVVDATLVRGDERVPVVVKKTRATARQRLGVPKAVRSYEVARELVRRGLPTPEPLGVVLKREESWFVARRVDGALEVRAWFMHRDDPAGVPQPALAYSFEDIVRALGRLARRLHEAGVFYRDFTDGNVLVTAGSAGPDLWLVDLNRVRVGPAPLGTLSRLRDLARPGLNRAADRKLFLESYFEPDPVPRSAERAVAALRARIVRWDELKRLLRPWRT